MLKKIDFEVDYARLIFKLKIWKIRCLVEEVRLLRGYFLLLRVDLTWHLDFMWVELHDLILVF